ncbi:uncharacterized protein [Nicotiana sylvestris]|uniref:uncharacterized protein n=1 Tax=Nicotiana sylvestris TaxID=4096 RepID=UPI00388CD147
MSFDALWRLDRFTKLFTTTYGGTSSEDPQDYLDSCHEVLQNIEIVETNEVNFATFRLSGSAKNWWRDYCLAILSGSSALTWDQFSRLFLEKFLPITQSEDYRRQFERLQQGGRVSHMQYSDQLPYSAPPAPISAPLLQSYRGGYSAKPEAEASDVIITCMVSVYNRDASVLFDPGSTYSYVSSYFSTYLVVPRNSLSAPVYVSTPYSDQLPYSAPPAPISAPLLQSYRGGYSAKPEAEASDVIITCMVSVYSRDVSVLFDPGSTYSYVSSYFSTYLVVPRNSLSAPVYVSTPVSDSIIVYRVYHSCVVIIGGLETRVDLLLLDMVDFNVILGMDWLSPYHTILDYHAKTVTLSLLGLPRLECIGTPVHSTNRVISYMKARRMVHKGCLAYLAYVRDPSAEVPSMVFMPIVREFPKVFSADLLEMPPFRNIDFYIDLAPGTQPIFISLYRMAPLELKQLKEQLQDLLDKGFIRPSVSP